MGVACTVESPIIPDSTVVPVVTPNVKTPVIPKLSASTAIEPQEFSGRTITILIGEARFSAFIADTTYLRSQGLSGRDELHKDSGMWFDFFEPQRPSFWMRGMKFPIDIIWINEAMSVVHVSHDVPTPLKDSPINALPRYDAEGHDVRYVLEIGAGLARALNIRLGTLASIESSPRRTDP